MGLELERSALIIGSRGEFDHAREQRRGQHALAMRDVERGERVGLSLERGERIDAERQRAEKSRRDRERVIGDAQRPLSIARVQKRLSSTHRGGDLVGRWNHLIEKPFESIEEGHASPRRAGEYHAFSARRRLDVDLPRATPW